MGRPPYPMRRNPTLQRTTFDSKVNVRRRTQRVRRRRPRQVNRMIRSRTNATSGRRPARRRRTRMAARIANSACPFLRATDSTGNIRSGPTNGSSDIRLRNVQGTGRPLRALNRRQHNGTRANARHRSRNSRVRIISSDTRRPFNIFFACRQRRYQTKTGRFRFTSGRRMDRNS